MFRVLGPKGHLILRAVTAATITRLLPRLIRRFKRVTVTAAPVDYRAKVVYWARWGVKNSALIHYAETRPYPPSMTLPMTTDCSGFATLCYKLAGAPDPNGLNYNGTGYTGTLLDHGQPRTAAHAQPGDLVFYGPGTAIHTAIVVEAGADPLTISHGQESEPAYVRVSQDNRQPVRYRSYLP